MFLVAVSGSGGGGGDDLSETNSSMLKRRVEDLNYKAEKVSVKVEIFVKLFGIMLLFNVRRVLEDSRRVEEELVFTVRNQKVRQPDRVVQVSLRYVLAVELLKMKGK